MVIGMYEFLQKVANLKTTEEKIEALKYNDSVQLRIILQGAFDPNVVWLLPPGNPPYKPNDLVDQQHVLLKDCEKIRYFVRGFFDNLKQTRRETMFVEFLERVDPQDAKLLLAIKEKRLPFDGITAYHVKAAFPDLLPDMLDVPPLQIPENNQETEISKPKRPTTYSPKGKKWYHSLEEKLEQLFDEGAQPENWNRGRLPKTNE